MQLEADPTSDSAVVVDTRQTLRSEASIGRNTPTILAPQEPPNTEATQPILDLIHVDVGDGAEDYEVVDLYAVMGGASAVDPTEDVPSRRHPLPPSPADVQAGNPSGMATVKHDLPPRFGAHGPPEPGPITTTIQAPPNQHDAWFWEMYNGFQRAFGSRRDKSISGTLGETGDGREPYPAVITG
jgi:hypothetical protein